MSDDPRNGVSAQAIAAAEGSPAASEATDHGIAETIGPLASNERAFDSRTREAARRRANASQRTAGAIGDADEHIVERGRDMLENGLDEFPHPREVVRQGRAAIQDQPAMALLIAGAIGFGLEWLIHRRDA